jgi:hypothetical protein
MSRMGCSIHPLYERRRPHRAVAGKCRLNDPAVVGIEQGSDFMSA